MSEKPDADASILLYLDETDTGLAVPYSLDGTMDHHPELRARTPLNSRVSLKIGGNRILPDLSLVCSDEGVESSQDRAAKCEIIAQLEGWHAMMVKRYGHFDDHLIRPIRNAFDPSTRGSFWSSGLMRPWTVSLHKQFLILGFNRNSLGPNILSCLHRHAFVPMGTRIRAYKNPKASCSSQAIATWVVFDLFSIAQASELEGITIEDGIQRITDAVNELGLAVWEMERDTRNIQMGYARRAREVPDGPVLSFRPDYGPRALIRSRIEAFLSDDRVFRLESGGDQAAWLDVMRVVIEITAWSILNGHVPKDFQIDPASSPCLISYRMLEQWFTDDGIVPPAGIVIPTDLRPAFDEIRARGVPDTRAVFEQQICLDGLLSDCDGLDIMLDATTVIAGNDIWNHAVLMKSATPGVRFTSTAHAEEWLRLFTLTSMIFEQLASPAYRSSRNYSSREHILKMLTNKVEERISGSTSPSILLTDDEYSQRHVGVMFMPPIPA